MKDDGHDERRRFMPGNPGGPGSPLAGRSAQLRAVLLDEVGPDEMRRVVRVVLQSALDGDLRACRELMDRGIGRAPLGLTIDKADPEDRDFTVVSSTVPYRDRDDDEADD